jgi:hypothetical protein
MFQGAPPMAVGTYDTLLNSWVEQPLQPKVLFNAGTSQYSVAGEAARQRMTDERRWFILDGGLAE